MMRRMRSEPASGAMVALRVPAAARVAASVGVTQSAFNDEGESRPPAATACAASGATPGTLAISAPTRPIVLRWRRPSATAPDNCSGLRVRIGRYMKPAAQKRHPHWQPRLASTITMSPNTASSDSTRVEVGKRFRSQIRRRSTVPAPSRCPCSSNRAPS